MQGPEHELQQIADKFNSEFDTYVDDNRSVNIGLKFSRGGRQWGADEKLSRALSSLLRHRGAKDGFTFLPGRCSERNSFMFLSLQTKFLKRVN